MSIHRGPRITELISLKRRPVDVLRMLLDLWLQSHVVWQQRVLGVFVIEHVRCHRVFFPHRRISVSFQRRRVLQVLELLMLSAKRSKSRNVYLLAFNSLGILLSHLIFVELSSFHTTLTTVTSTNWLRSQWLCNWFSTGWLDSIWRSTRMVACTSQNSG